MRRWLHVLFCPKRLSYWAQKNGRLGLLCERCNLWTPLDMDRQ